MNRNSKEGDEEMMWKCVAALAAEAEWFKTRKQGEEEAAGLRAQLNAFAEGSAANAKKVMSRMSAGSDEALKAMTFATWNDFVVQYKKDKEMNDAVKSSEQKVKAMMAKQKDGASSVLTRMQGASETGLLTTCFQGWFEIMDTNKKQEYMQHVMEQKAAKMGDFNARNKKGAMSATAKVAYLHDIQFMLWA